ncbi:hypothetical protein [Actinospica sp.]|jgi:hypothetical protein|uniref:hypothetical protein n=1 Tax=Actinospica sp. TaxID=1872142 RepID=UPI002CDDDA07|nr:hypothetical protein [Actinospica sp.]HWG25484.1 hypothetical protein [Actinospica sp.]
MATYYVIARMDGTRQIGPDRQVVDLAAALERGITQFIAETAAEPDEERAEGEREPYGLLLHPEPAETGLGIADDMTLTLGVDGAFRVFQLQAVPIPEHFVPASAVGAQAIFTREFLATAEVPAWWAYGPSGRRVLGLLYALSGLKREQLDRIGRRIDAAGLAFARDKFDALAAADTAIGGAGRPGAARLARGYARAATYGTWEKDSALSHAASAAGDVAYVLTVADLLQEDVVDRLAHWLAPEIPEIGFGGEDEEYPKPGQPEPEPELEPESEPDAQQA